MIEDHQGRYWTTDRAWPCVRSHPCSDPTCLWSVTLQRDVLGQWFARHQHSDFNPNTPWLHTGPSTVTSPRYRDWQDAARWAADRGLLAP